MKRVARRFREVETPVEVPRPLVFRMDDDCPDAGDVSGLQGPQHGVAQQPCADALALPVNADAEAGQQRDRQHGVPGKTLCEAFRRVVIADFADGQRVEADDGIVGKADIGL